MIFTPTFKNKQVVNILKSHLSCVLIADSGSTDTLIRVSESSILRNITPHTGLTVRLPNGDLITSSAIGKLNISSTGDAITAYVFPDSILKHSLLSLSQLCNIGYTATLTDRDISISKDAVTIMYGTKNTHDKLWNIQLGSSTKQQDHTGISTANTSVRLETDAEFVAFVHATFGSPCSSAFLEAARKGYLDSYPRITATMIAANKPNTVETAKGHLDQTRQGQYSTKATRKKERDNNRNVTNINTIAQNNNEIEETNDPEEQDDGSIYVKTLSLSDTNHTDLTGRFPITSRRGNQYVLVSVFEGYVRLEPMASRKGTSYVKAYQSMMEFFRSHGRVPKFQRLDNETSGELEKYLREQQITIQYVPPHTHRANKAERAIRDVKNHLISTLCTVHASFPLTLWDEMLPQAEITINHLRKYTPDTRMSAYEGIHQHKYNFKAHPIAPFGTLVVIHEKPAQRASWDTHGVKGFYLGPAVDHYRSWRTWAITTQTIRITDTVAWFPEIVKMPGSSPQEMMTAAVADLANAMKLLAKSDSIGSAVIQPFNKLAETATAQLHQLVAMFQSKQTTETTPAAVPTTDTMPLAPAVAPIAITTTSESAEKTPDTLQTIVEETETYDDQRVSTHMTRRQQAKHDQLMIRRIDNATARRARTAVPFSTELAESNAALNLTDLGEPLTYSLAKQGPNAADWEIAESKEISKLIDTKTMHPIHANQQPHNRRRDTTYYNPQTKEKINAAGEKTYRIRGTIGGDRINYPGAVAARTADMEVVKIVLNSVVSDDAHWMTIDIVDYYLNTPLERPEYLRINVKFIPNDVIIKYNLRKYINNKSILFEVNKGMYGLPQAGILAQQRLTKHLAIAGYHQSSNVPCLFRHDTNGISFTLVVDDFGIKFKDKASADHLISTLQELYAITIDWEGKKYLGITIDFDKKEHSVSLSMPGYISKLLQRFQPSGLKQAASPSNYIPPKYGQTTQYTNVDDSAVLTAAEKKRIQEIVGSLLYYARAVDLTMLTAVNAIASEQANPTQAVKAQADRLLAYAASYPNNKLVMHACDMILIVQSDASYLSRSKSRSVAGGIGYLGNKDDCTFVNGCMFAISNIIDVVVASAAEAEYAAVFINGQHAEWTRTILSALGYQQPATLILTDNECAVGLANDTVKIKRAKTVDMRFHWIRDRIKQGHFNVKWQKGANNLADFFTKSLPVHVHQTLMKKLVVTPPAAEAHFTMTRGRRANSWRLRKQKQ